MAGTDEVPWPKNRAIVQGNANCECPTHATSREVDGSGAYRYAREFIGSDNQPHLQLPQVRFNLAPESAIRLRHYSPRTEEAYVGWIRRFVIFHQKRHPAEMGDSEVRQFLTDLAEKQSVSASTQNQALNALVSLYREVLQMPLGKMGLFVRAKRPKNLPLC
jgi:hypothetical protein